MSSKAKPANSIYMFFQVHFENNKVIYIFVAQKYSSYQTVGRFFCISDVQPNVLCGTFV